MPVADTFVRRAKPITATPIFSFWFPNGSGRIWRFLKKSSYRFFLLERFGVVNPLDLQLKFTKVGKKLQFSTSVSEKTNTVSPNLFLISGIVMKRKADIVKNDHSNSLFWMLFTVNRHGPGASKKKAGWNESRPALTGLDHSIQTSFYGFWLVLSMETNTWHVLTRY